MKKIMMVALSACCCLVTRAQTGEEWTERKNTQLKYAMQQLLALRSYGLLVMKGYGIVRDGSTLIEQIKTSDFTLHEKKISSLTSINPVVFRYPKLAEARQLYQQAVHLVAATKHRLLTPLLNDLDKKHFLTVLQKVEANLVTEKQFLESLVTHDEWQLGDAERIRLLDSVYATIRSEWSYVNCFNQNLKIYGYSHVASEHELRQMKLIQGLTN
jgi:hypothetical protein